MDVYILDEQIRRTTLVDTFESLVWTERWNEVGDFELVMQSTLENRNRFKLDTWLAIKESKRVMVVQTIEDTDDEEGRPILKLSGQSLEYVLNQRVASINYGPAAFTAANWIRELFKAQYGEDAIYIWGPMPFLKPGSIYPASTLPESTDILYDLDILEDEPSILLDSVIEWAKAYDLGFRLVRNLDKSELYFDVYTGDDRTSSQTVRPAVVFSPALENIRSTTYLQSNENHKNLAIVSGPSMTKHVYGNGADENTNGFDLKVLYVKAWEVDFENQPWLDEETELIRLGNQKLAEHRVVLALDGELAQVNGYIYEEDYFLGDLVEMRNDDGVTNIMRVTEQIIVSDSEGDRSYPTVSSNLVVQPGTWEAYEWNIDWDEAGDITWDGAAV